MAEELEAEKAEAAEKDGKMEVEGADGEVENGVDEDEMSEDGSVDIEGESEDELEEDLEEEGEGEGEPMEGDDMDIDMDKPVVPAAGAKPEGMVH